jgi:hypothetical protein
MRRRITILFVLVFFSHLINAQKASLGLKDFLKEYYDLSALPSYIKNSYSAEVSTYDRTGMNDDGFNGTYSFIRRNADSSLVIFDVKGSGVVNRIWTPTPSDDSLDFYIDNDIKPSFTICYQDLFSGKVYPFVAPLCANQLGGYYCYLPIPFNVSCKIVLKAKKTMFHQVGYRLYPKGVTIEKFALPLNKEEQQILAILQSTWNKPSASVADLYSSHSNLSVEKKNLQLTAGQTATAFETKQAGRILGFDISSSVSLDKIAKDVDLKITWDGEKSPAVYCSLADYFGYAFGKPSMRSLIIGCDGEKNYSYFPMPFDKSAKVELIYRKPTINNGITQAAFTVNIYFVSQKRDIVKEGKFYAYWVRNNPVPDGQPHTMLDIKGRGHLVGNILQAQGLKEGMTVFFEGDDSTVADGELRMHGTGSEDFFNGGWYALMDRWDAAMSLPLSGALEYSLPLCRTGGYRLFVGDKISFEKTLFHSIEHGPEHNAVPSDYTSVAYYYCSQPNVQSMVPSAANTKPVYLDTLNLYPQLMNIGIDGDVNVETKWAFPTGGLTYYYTIKENTVLRLSLKEIPVGNYRLYLDYIKAPEGAQFSIWQRQTQLTGWMDCYSDKIERKEMQDIHGLLITSLNNTVSLRFKVNGAKNQFILNRIILVRQ